MTSEFSEYYSNKASDIDNHWLLFTQIQFEWILNRLKSRYKKDDCFSVMDLGCGTGRLLSLIHEMFPNAILNGVDGTFEMVEISQGRLGDNALIAQADFNEYILQDHYDVIISTTVLHHLDNPQQHLNMIQNRLNDQGHVYVSEFAVKGWRMTLGNFWWSLTQASHIKAWGVRVFQEMIGKNGLTICDKAILKPDNFWQLQIYDLENVRNVSS